MVVDYRNRSAVVALSRLYKILIELLDLAVKRFFHLELQEIDGEIIGRKIFSLTTTHAVRD